MIQVEKFFCFQLLTGAVIIGWYGLAESIASSVTGIVMLENVDTYFTPANFPDFDAKTARALFINVVGTAVALGVLNVLACGLLIIGTVKRNHLLLVPWLVKNAISLATLYVILVVCVILLFTSGDTGAVFAAILFIAVALAFYSYIWVTIYSLYVVLRREPQNSERESLIRNAQGPARQYNA